MVFLVPLLLVGGLAGAQEPEPPAGGEGAAAEPGEVFVDTVDVNVVNVEVYVTDKDGNRVTGLTRDDFEVYEDRRPVTITNFYAVEDGRPVREFPRLETPVEPPEPLPVPGVAADGRAAVPEEQRLNLIVYIDNFNIRPFNRNRVLRELRVFLGEEVRVGDRVMLVSYDRSLKILRPFTTDPQAVASALVELERVTGHAAIRDNDRRDVMERIQDAGSPNQALIWARGYAEEVNNDLRFTIDALKELVNWLSGLPGRKAVLYVSDGLPMVPAQELFHAVDALHPAGSGAITESLGFDASRLFQELAAQANANRVTFYTIDAAGLRVDSSIDVQNRTAQPISISSIDTHNLQAPLRYVADATGGMAILNRNRVLPALEQVATDFETYYSLGYPAPEAGRGRYHRIEVKVPGRRGLTVRHRDGYRDKTVEARMTDGTMTVLRFEIARNPIEARLEFGEAIRRRGEQHWVLPVEVRIPIENITLVPRAESHEGRLRLFVAARDAAGDTSPVQQATMPVSIPADAIERARGEDWVYRIELLMRGGPHLVAVGVRDELASSESFVSRSVVVGGGEPAALGGL
jgi:VWFA-related protein